MTEPQPTPSQAVGAFASYNGYRLASRVTRSLPRVVTDALTPSIGLGARLISRQRRALIERHLQRVDPTLEGSRLEAAVQGAFDSYTRYWVESFRLPHLPASVVADGLETDGYQHVLTGLEAGRGVILALPHLGGWEWAGRWLADQGHGLTVVVERIEPPQLFTWFADLRAALGMRVVPLGPDAGREVIAALNRNDIVCLLSDRDIQHSGVEVDFFGERTTLPPGPAMLGLRTGAPVLPTAVYFTDRTDGHLGFVRPPLTLERSEGRLRDDVAAGTQQLALELEFLIRRAPQQWHLFQPNWPSDAEFSGQ